MLALGQRAVPPVLRVAAATGEGTDALVAALDARRGIGEADRLARRRAQAARRVLAIAAERARDAARAAIGTLDAPGPLASLIDQVTARTLDPWSAADAFFQR
jgi:putative protein kinase ArgK-like GTPase of G3E family